MSVLESFDFVVAMLARNGQRHVFLIDSDPASVVALESVKGSSRGESCIYEWY